MTVALEINGHHVELDDHAAEAIGLLAASRGTIDWMTLADELLARAEHREHSPLFLDASEQVALLSVVAEVPPDSARPELRAQLTELREALETNFDPD